jgi:hypothetical protein
MIFVALSVLFFGFALLSAFTFGGAAIAIVLALVGMVVLGAASVLGGASRGGLRPTFDRADRSKPELLGPGGPDDPDAR